MVNLSEHVERSLRSPALVHAGGALGAVAAGFGLASASIFANRGPSSRFGLANAIAAAGCSLAALGLRLAAAKTDEVHENAKVALTSRSHGAALDFSIIIPVFNRRECVRDLLAKLAEQSSAWHELGRGEVVVVDDGSTDGSAFVAREMALSMPIPTVVFSKNNGGVSSARNAGFSCARGEVGVVIDSDCIPEEEWLPAMLRAVRSDRRVVAFARIRAGKRPVYPLENVPDRKGLVGASFAMHRKSYLELGGCFEEYGASCDDRDFVVTAIRSGYRAGHVAAAWITHPLRRETLRSIWRAGLNSRNANLFARRHGPYAALGKPSPYYLFGIGSSHGSSVALIVGLSNALLTAFFAALSPADAKNVLSEAARTAVVAFSAYVLVASTLGLLVGASARQLPRYVVTLAAFQVATLIGRLDGSLRYGVLLL